jgi:hypothetical protein
VPYNASGAALLRKVQDAGYRDEGTGSTFAALERRGLVLCKYEPGSLGGPIVFERFISTHFLDRPERTQRILSWAFRYVIDELSRLQL